MSELDELYQEIIMEHNRKPRNFRKLERADRSADGYNPFCGDKITLYLNLNGEAITDIGFISSGCAISRAAASMMTQSVKGKTEAEVSEIFEAYHKMLTRALGADFDASKLGDLEILAGVAEFPTRVKCASLGWHTLNAALKGQGEPVSTE